MQQWDETLFQALSKAGGSVYSNYAVGFNNVKVPDANKHGIAVGNTPGTSACLHQHDVAHWAAQSISTVCEKPIPCSPNVHTLA